MAKAKVSLEDKISLGKNSFSSVTIYASVEREVGESDEEIEEGLRGTATLVEEYMAEERSKILEALDMA